MELKTINSVQELLDIAPAVFKFAYKEDKHGAFKQMAGQDFANMFFANFRPGWYFGSLVNGELEYFCAIVPSGSDGEAQAWLFYMNPKLFKETSLVIQKIKSVLRERGIGSLLFTTTRLTSSYRRWAEKNGARQIAIIYKMEV